MAARTSGQEGRWGVGGKLTEVRGQEEKSATDTLITQDSLPSRPLTDRDELHGFTAQMTHVYTQDSGNAFHVSVLIVMEWPCDLCMCRNSPANRMCRFISLPRFTSLCLHCLWVWTIGPLDNF